MEWIRWLATPIDSTKVGQQFTSAQFMYDTIAYTSVIISNTLYIYS